MRDRAAFLTLVAFLTGLAVAGCWLAAVRQHTAALRWQYADADGDGLPLVADADSDGDGLFGLEDPDADGDGVPNAADAVRAGLSLRGTLSDPLMGKYSNVLGRAGFRVCTDVTVETWLAAGVSAPALLLEAAASHPEWFAIDAGNHPQDPNFVRRVRNYRALFSQHPGLGLGDRPRLGAWAFYGDRHVALVTGVDGVGYSVTEAYGAALGSISGAVVEARSGERAAFGLIPVVGE